MSGPTGRSGPTGGALLPGSASVIAPAFESEMAGRRSPDGTVASLTSGAGFTGAGFVVGAGERRALVIHDSQHEYAFTER